ncbi:hypothetical protein LO762_02525 [Actinocorallia sp. API 0066]|uniref:hypothetical protein n=1 Tax=Actinocorallia sp. API 0066 TaxID=2896846 RepID=UPI001E505039|nr:hypothetical protein [Actinocorallia sp. API 0066]MCD0448077.1 hypothetical protein [Actinocorallia sp. API 0066]
MSELSPDEALAQIGRTQQRAYARQQLPLWYPAGFAALMTVTQIGLDAEIGVLFFLAGLGGIAGMGAMMAALGAWARVRWAKQTWTRSALAAYAGWALVAVVLAFGTHNLVFDGFEAPWRKLAAGGVVVVYFLLTTRPAEALILRLSRGKVVA